MLTTSVLIILHEVLEAAFIFAALLALTASLGLSMRWSLRGLAIGILLAAVYGFFLREVSSWFGGTGQEIVNLALQVTAYFALLVCVFKGARESFTRTAAASTLPTAMTVAASCAVALEGAEIFVYIAGFIRSDAAVASASIGSFVGLCIGLSIGVLFYHLLQLLSQARSRLLILSCVVLVGTGMAAQGTRELVQASLITVGSPLWDTSKFLPEDSVVGQFLYALGGYEATPSAAEVGIYLVTLALMILACLVGRQLRHQSSLADA